MDVDGLVNSAGKHKEIIANVQAAIKTTISHPCYRKAVRTLYNEISEKTEKRIMVRWNTSMTYQTAKILCNDGMGIRLA